MIVAQLKAWSFPLRRGPRGFFAVSTSTDVIRERIEQVLGTPTGGRIGWPSYGCDIHRLVFAPNDRLTQKRASDAIRQSIAAWVREVTVQSVDVTVDPSDPHTLPVSISYKVNQTGALVPLDLDVPLQRG